MKIKKIFYTRNFCKRLQKFPQKQKDKMIKKTKRFMDNPFEPSLKTYKLTGKLKSYWSFSLSSGLRIMFRFADSETVEFIDIGGHGIYK